MVSLLTTNLSCQPAANVYSQNSLVSQKAFPLIIHGIQQDFVRVPKGKFLMGSNERPNEPVVAISWNDAMAFCEWLSGITGRRIRLPSEAEWEFASLDTTGTYYNSYPEIAWIYDNSGLTTHPVAQKKPNSNGLYNLLGNVSEWMMDVWHPDYEGAPSDGSSRLGEPSTARVYRGGSFERETGEISRRARDWYNESEPLVGTGFRIVDTGISPHQ